MTKMFWLLPFVLMPVMFGCAMVKPGPVSGTLKVDGKTIPLKYVYALQYDALEGISDNAEVRIILADKEVLPGSTLPPHYVFDTFGPLNELGREGKICGVVLKLDPKAPLKRFSGILLYPPKSEGQTLTSFSYSGTKSAFKKLKIAAERAEGEIAYVSEPSEDVPGFELNVSFDAPIVPEEKATEKLEGAKALNSPQVQAFLKFVRACGKADLKELSGIATAKKFKELEAIKKQAGEAEFIKMLAWPSTQPVEKQIRSVIVRGKRAWIAIEMGGEKMWMTAIQEGGAWKID